MTSALGLAHTGDLLPKHNQRIRDAVEVNGGYVVKTIGDSFMLAFDNARNAAAVAAIQQSITMSPLAATDKHGRTWTIKVRIGTHKSVEDLEPKPSPESKADYLGNDVNFAARVESLAAGGQILASESAHEAMEGLPWKWQEWPNRRIKSFDQPETVFELLWDGQSRGEPGARFRPDWFKGELNQYIQRPELESQVLAHFAKLRDDGSVPRLVTLHASGGMGKTRLAIACAIQVVGVFPDGVFFVKLDDTAPTAAGVAEAIGNVLGLPREVALPPTLPAALARKETDGQRRNRRR